MSIAEGDCNLSRSAYKYLLSVFDLPEQAVIKYFENNLLLDEAPDSLRRV